MAGFWMHQVGRKGFSSHRRRHPQKFQALKRRSQIWRETSASQVQVKLAQKQAQKQSQEPRSQEQAQKQAQELAQEPRS